MGKVYTLEQQWMDSFARWDNTPINILKAELEVVDEFISMYENTHELEVKRLKMKKDYLEKLIANK